MINVKNLATDKLFSVCIALDVDTFYEWLDEVKVNKKVKNSLEYIGGKDSFSTNVVKLIRGEFEFNEDIDDWCYAAVFGDHAGSIPLKELLKNLKLYSKGKDLKEHLAWNAPEYIFDDLPGSVMDKYLNVSISCALD